ncbi:solute carrier family 22 member 13 isoform X2 [Danio aesculapii]|uniref:solute carrier family 22 member 13 isoform X2 n=1 Tax=Danio aesculapii TaxID=1142201 RepID=UPI0024C07D54|nr:solute carrier family 22 member 13 isoform X2 [Danio aesculapii]
MANFGEILEAIGDFGLFQKLLLFALCFPNLILPFQLSSLVFNHADTNHHCNTDWILKVGPNLTKEEQLNLTLPRLSDGSFNPCQMYVPVDWNLSAIWEYGLNQTTTCTDGWVHNDTIYEATIVTDFDLVCENVNIFRGAQTVFFAGVLVGAILFGPFSESFGRKRATQIPMVLMLIFTVVTGLSPNFYVYLVSQFINGIGLGGFRINSIILACEWIGVAQRSYAACLSQVLAALGQVMFLAVVYFVRDWRLDQFIMAGPIATVVIYIWFLPESARWLLDRGRNKDAKKLIQKAAAVNKRAVPESLVEEVLKEKPVEKGGIKILFRSRVLRKYFLAITFAWCALNLAYYSMSLNVGKFGLDIFLTQLIFGLSEIPVHFLCMWSLEVVGRKPSLIFSLVLGGSLCLLTVAVPQNSSIAIAVLATCGRFLMNAAGSVCNVYFQELFPTSIRQTATGLGSTAARAASMLSPVVNMLEMFHFSIPMVVISSLALASGATAFLLPETRRTELPASTEEAEGKRKPRMTSPATRDREDTKVTKL